MQDSLAKPGARAWYIVALLCLLATVSYLDRYIIALLAAPIMEGLDISETQIGLLIGVGFGLVYSIAAFPLAHLVDRGVRVRIVAAGVVVWSAATIGSGFAPTFEVLLFTRVGVAIGEAVLVPAAVSLIADLFPLKRRTLPIGCFMAVSALMGSGAFIIGGFAFDMAVKFPGVGFEAWRMTLVFVGAPGLLLALVWWLTVREPPRRIEMASDEVVSIQSLLEFLSARWQHYVPIFLALGLQGIGIYSFISWTSTILVRSYDLSVAQAGYYYGTFGLVAAAIASVFWPACNSFVTRKGRPELSLVFLATGLALALLSMASLHIIKDVVLAAVMIGIATFAFAAAGTLTVLIFQAAAPSRLRGKVVSLYMMTGNLIGLVIGPPFSAWLAGALFDGPHALRSSLALIGIVLAPAVGGLVLLSMRKYREMMEQVSAAAGKEVPVEDGSAEASAGG